MPVTLLDVAVRAGVSKSAVSRTFTPGASVSAKTRAKVEAAARALGYQPNVLASSLTTGRTKLIGLISNNFTNPFFLEIFDHFTRAIQDAGLRPLLINLSDEVDAGKSLGMLRQYNVDGVIVASSTLPPEFAMVFHDAGLPVVHAFGWSQPSPRTALVSIDNAGAGALAAQTLLARDYRKIGFLGGPESAATTQDRAKGFADVLTAAGLNPALRYAEAYSYAAGRVAMLAAQAARPDVEAWFCGDDVIAVGAMDAARSLGLDVPGDIGFLGLNDMAMASWDRVALTTIRQPLTQIVERSVDLIQRGIDAPDEMPGMSLLPCKLVERGTLRALP
ncbi:LacI family DNA-binding transcriptional regulator [Primorskyibacter aestuariivivens]|uniref:LacI family DNA-binding transcriptional regulator n=1 Tax=Primorskyibacter aestuariivivens TaxID=1888912 RepID=UPI0022FFE2B9|nr:LacI family DNA-binding transcriptional regulator [Primorskyibacter aestuariivivens]MDA7428990.1 LacI family DNA-binding transcriptional regulator [Primorskyibacter aestuariivivens]